MSSAARLDLTEQELAPNIAHLDSATLDLTSPEVVVDFNDAPVLDIEVVEEDLLLPTAPVKRQTDDPAMLFVYAGTMLFAGLLIIAAVLALS